MGLFDDIEPVPFRLLDELQAQMDANRERINIQQELKGLTRPRPQRSIFNATMSSYRRPEPAAHPFTTNHNAFLFEWALQPNPEDPSGPQIPYSPRFIAYPDYTGTEPGASSPVKTALLRPDASSILAPLIKWTQNTQRGFVVPGYEGPGLPPVVPPGGPRYFNWTGEPLRQDTGPNWPYSGDSPEPALTDDVGRSRFVAGVPGFTITAGDYKALPLGGMRKAGESDQDSIDGYVFPGNLHTSFTGLTYEMDVKFYGPEIDFFMNCQMKPPGTDRWQSIYLFYFSGDWGGYGELYTEPLEQQQEIITENSVSRNAWVRWSVTYDVAAGAIYWHANGNMIGFESGVPDSLWDERLLWLTTFEAQSWYPASIGRSRVTFLPLYGFGSYTPRSLLADPRYIA